MTSYHTAAWFEEDIEEIYQANVHLHKDVHTLGERLDRIEEEQVKTETVLEEILFTRLDRIEKLLGEPHLCLTCIYARLMGGCSADNRGMHTTEGMKVIKCLGYEEMKPAACAPPHPIGESRAAGTILPYRCLRCGAFVAADNESRADRVHYMCLNCMSTGYIYESR